MSTIGTPKASVLPEPVGDFASTSRPASTSGTTALWIGKGLSKPRASSAPATAEETPRSAKDCGDNGLLLCCGAIGTPLCDSGDSADPDRAMERPQRQRTSRAAP